MQNRYIPPLTDQLRLITPERVQTILGLFDRDVFAAPGRSIEVYREGHYLCSLRVSEAGMGTDVKPAIRQVKLRNGDNMYSLDLGPRVLYLGNQLETRDNYRPTYKAEITVRVNNPLVFLHHYFQARQDIRMDPMARFQAAVGRAFKRYAEATEHDKIKERDFESAAFKNREGRNLGIWIERSVTDITKDPQRQQIREIEKQAEIDKARERSRGEVQNVKSDYSRKERYNEANFTLDEEARKQVWTYQQKLREIVFMTVQPQWTEYILRELEKVDNSVPEFFRKNPQLFQQHPGLNQLFTLPPPQLSLGSPSPDKRRQQENMANYNNPQKRRDNDPFF